MKCFHLVLITIVIGWGLLGSTPSIWAKKQITLAITGENIAQIVEQFNQSQSEYEVRIKAIQFRNWRHALNLFRFQQEQTGTPSSENTADLVFVDNNWLPSLIQAQSLMELTGKVGQMNNFIDGLVEASSKDNRIYATPFSNKGLVLFYRKDLHQKHNLPVPNSLETLEKNALFLMKKESLDHGVTLHYTAIHLDILPFLWSNGGTIIDKGKVVLNSPQNRETFAILAAMSRNKIFPSPKNFPYLKKSYGNAKKLFIQGKSAYLISWNNRITDFEKSSLAGKFGILPLPPVKSENKSFSVIGTWYFAINPNSSQKEGALRFLNYFYSDPAQLYLSSHTIGFLTALKPLYQHPDLQKNNPYINSLQNAMQHMRHRLQHPKEAEISFLLENMIRLVVLEGKDAGQMLPTISTRIEKILNE